MSIFERLRKTIAATLNVEPGLIRETTSQKDLSSWDSLGHINLIVAVEDTFDVALEVDDINRLTSVPAILAYLSDRGID
jgi:acyl carrier protein